MEGYLRAAVEALKRRASKDVQVRRLRRPGGSRPLSKSKSSYDDGVRIAAAAAKKYDQEIRKIK